MIPFVRTAWELERCLNLAVQAHPCAAGLPVWVMAEVPSVAYWIPTYAEMGMKCVHWRNDLTQLVLGVDRDSEVCAELFDEADLAVLDTIARIIAACHEAGISSSLCVSAIRPTRVRREAGAAGHYIDLGEPDVVHQVRDIIAGAERRILLAASAPWRAAAPTISPRHRLHGFHGRS